MEMSFCNRPTNLPKVKINPTVEYVDSFLPLACQNYHGGYYHVLGGRLEGLKATITEEHAEIGILRTSDVSSPDLEAWPITHTVNDTGRKYSFSVNQTMQTARQLVNQKNPEIMTVRIMGGYTQIWDGFMWLTPGYGHLNTQAPPCWKQQQNHSKQEPTQLYPRCGMTRTLWTFCYTERKWLVWHQLVVLSRCLLSSPEWHSGVMWHGS